MICMHVLCLPTTGDQEPVIALRVRKLVSIRTYGMEWSPMFSIWVPTRKGGDGLDEKEARPIHLSCRTSLFLRPGTRDLPVSAESDRSISGFQQTSAALEKQTAFSSYRG